MITAKESARFNELPTPFYFYDMELLNRTVGEAKRAAGKYGYKIHYALKCNFDPRIAETMAKAGFGADCVSGNEVKYAVEHGFSADGIVYAGVGKSDGEINCALEAGIFAFNCESLQELQVIDALAKAKGTTAQVALRINPGIDAHTHKYISTGNAYDKFGISEKEIEMILNELPEMKNIRVIGLHFHVGSQITDMEVFRLLARRANELQDWYAAKGMTFGHLNLGGGLGIDYNHPQAHPVADFETYFRTFSEELNVRPGQQVHFELGRSLTAQSGTLISKVLIRKDRSVGHEFLIIDAGMNDLIRPSLYQAKHAISNITSTATESAMYNIGGPVCESSDIFARDIELPLTQRGDLIAIYSAGAYGQAMASRYNLRDFAPAVYSDQL